MAVPLSDVIQILTTVILVVLVPIQGWMLKTLIDLIRWRAMQEERCQQHAKRDHTLEQDTPVIKTALATQGQAIVDIRSRIDDIIAKLDMIDQRLDIIEKGGSN